MEEERRAYIQKRLEEMRGDVALLENVEDVRRAVEFRAAQILVDVGLVAELLPEVPPGVFVRIKVSAEVITPEQAMPSGKAPPNESPVLPTDRGYQIITETVGPGAMDYTEIQKA